MKILIAAAKYLPAVGGLEKSVHNIALEFKERGHEVSIITNAFNRTLPDKEIIDGIKIQRCFFTTIPPKTWEIWIWIKYFVRLALGPYSLFTLWWKISKEKPDIVHLHFVGAIAAYVYLVRKFKPFYLVVSLHGSDVERFEDKNLFERWILKKVLMSADFVTSNSRHLLEEALQKTRLLSLEHSGVVPMAFSADRYEDLATYHHAKPYIFAAGRFVYKKGMDVLLRAFAMVLKEGHFTGDLIIAGDGEELFTYRWLAKELKIQDRIVFYGVADWSQMVSLLKGCELFVIPSRLEAFGIVLLEALYAGKKVIASKVGGLIELMADNPNCLSDPGDPEMLAAKIKDVLSNKLYWNVVDRQKLRENYSWGKVTRSYFRIYERLVPKTYLRTKEERAYDNK